METNETVPQKLERINVQELNVILGDAFPVLDKGFIRVIDYMGGDARVVQAARVSYGKGTKKVSEDEGLIRFLLRHSHTTPFEMPKITLHVRVPMDCWRQWIRHRMSNTNEYSTRYSEAIDDKQSTPPDAWRLQAGGNKQGSQCGNIVFPENFDKETVEAFHGDAGQYLSSREHIFQLQAKELYEERLSFDVAKEQARKDLPLSTYTEAYWTCDLHNLMHFLSLRMDSHAQQEVRAYANVIGNEIVARWCPISWKAFNDYNFRRDALLLSARDKFVIQLLCSNDIKMIKFSIEDESSLLKIWGWLDRKEDGTLKTNRERAECEQKLKVLGFEIPW